MNNNPFFSVIVPTYNRGHLIRVTLNSLLNQSFKEFEVIVIDDGSTDHTEEIVGEIGSEKIKYFKVENGERGRARNIGTSYSQGKYVTFLDSDDILYENCLKEAYKFTKSKSEPEVFSLAYDIKSSSGEVVSKMSFGLEKLNRALLKGNIMSCIGVFLRKDIAIRHPFEESRGLVGSEDWLLWLQLASKYPIWHSKDVSAALIDHSERSVLQFSEKKLLIRIEMLVAKLSQDDHFTNAFGNRAIKKIKGHMFTYMALHAALASQPTLAYKYMIKGWLTAPVEILRRRSLAIIKHCIK